MADSANELQTTTTISASIVLNTICAHGMQPPCVFRQHTDDNRDPLSSAILSHNT